ncbi:MULTISPECIES: Lrp/AsnC family transcriptional regulator [Sphingobium]|uniref:Lrp/AsnC family transcriptional regulator n=1 Tax=Sphingobium cupriresistens TaxID=1132417 RepID=A0A8G1ZGG1_9SPHN|nr:MULTISPECIES: Lrp/AsnC family transcriptional regulator [Sphingobium]MBJ7377223.1 Lrp/AsnC family transcriptional regulator [Sphingobium sp.]RYM11507.1 Lrp/AsnC family transcriptional regulator [Sphingobium cupriresistens]WCP13719.1 DNA-binding transcriptional activator DecR [Sphingobium sp. AntQ-1]
MIDLDAVDRRILDQLQSDATLSNAELAERVGSSAASCWRRVRALEAAGVLGPAVRLLNAVAIDRKVNVFCNIRVRSHAREVRAPFEAFVRERREIIECYSMSGDWDYLLRVVASDVEDYERFLMRVLLEHPAVGGASSHFALSLTKYTTALPV